MADDTFVPIPASIPLPAAETRGVPRCVQPDRAQMSCLPHALDDLLEPDHPARAIWAYVEGLDLGGLYAEIRAVDGVAERAATDPRLLLLGLLALLAANRLHDLGRAPAPGLGSPLRLGEIQALAKACPCAA